MAAVFNALQDFPGGPVVKNLPSNAGNADLILVRELRSHMPQGNEALSSKENPAYATTREKPTCLKKDPAQTKFLKDKQ